MAVLIQKTAVSHCILQLVGHGRTGVLKRSDHKDVKMETGGGGGGDAESCDSSALARCSWTLRSDVKQQHKNKDHMEG